MSPTRPPARRALPFLALTTLLFLIPLAGLPAAGDTRPRPIGPGPALPPASPTAARATRTARPAPAPTARPAPTATPLPLAPGDLNVLLLGSDRRSADGAWRTDTIVVAAVRPRAGFVALFSVPRDLWVTIPGHGEGRINQADYLGEAADGPGGGPDLVAATLQRNLGLPVHAYARVDLEGLQRIIDSLGGVIVDVGPDCGHIGLDPGPQRLDGRAALRYARDRARSSDLERTRRQQQILLAIRDAALRPAVLLQLPQLLPELFRTVDTDLTPGQVLTLVRLARRLPPGAYRTRVFDRDMVSEWTTPGGAMVLLPHRRAIDAAWAQLTTP